MRLFFITFILTMPLFLKAQLNTGWGFSAGRLLSKVSTNDPWIAAINSGGWRGAIFVDKPLSHRFSLHGEMSTRYIPARPFPNESNLQRIIYPEINLGGTEYLPMGRGALYLNAMAYFAYGFGTERTRNANGSLSQGTDMFEEGTAYNRIQTGITLRLGYQFINGLFINSAVQIGLLTPYTKNEPVGQRYHESNWQIINLGYMFGYQKRGRISR